MTRIYNVIERDITFERVRHMPRRTRVCSVHRQLSWACHKEIQLYEKDARVTTNGLDRSKTAMQNRFKELLGIQKKMLTNKRRNSDRPMAASPRRASCPAVLSSSREATTTALAQTHQLPDDGENDVFNLPATDSTEPCGTKSESNPEAKSDFQKLPRSVSMNVKFSESANDAKGSSNDEEGNDVQQKDVPVQALQRRKTLPNL